jgi:membrane-associated phospholipid phosphatase
MSVRTSTLLAAACLAAFPAAASANHRSPGPEAYAAALASVRSLGSVDSTTRTPEQTDTARFWSSGIHIYWSAVGARVAGDRGLSLEKATRLIAAMNLALADTTIAYYDSKYAYKLWRPVTAIREGGDAAWTPLVNTPSDPSYPGAHSALSAAGAAVLEDFFGRDIAIVVRSPAGVERTYGHATDAAAEAGVARLWGGVHYPFDDPAGQKLGRSVGRYVAARVD